jgi:hypothetical protein
MTLSKNILVTSMDLCSAVIDTRVIYYGENAMHSGTNLSRSLASTPALQLPDKGISIQSEREK